MRDTTQPGAVPPQENQLDSERERILLEVVKEESPKNRAGLFSRTREFLERVGGMPAHREIEEIDMAEQLIEKLVLHLRNVIADYVWHSGSGVSQNRSRAIVEAENFLHKSGLDVVTSVASGREQKE